MLKAAMLGEGEKGKKALPICTPVSLILILCSLIVEAGLFGKMVVLPILRGRPV